jgi:SAM-dependent methyltransferase
MGSGSVNFDRAAEYYDQSRSLTPEASAELIRVAAAELAGRGRCLEIGVGTGRVALPLAAAGIPALGVDISAQMLARLVAKSGGRAPFPLALADATALPFPDATFGAAVAAHVLHLIPPWRQALAELVRVVRPGGVVLALMETGVLDAAVPELRERFNREAGLARRNLGAADAAELDAAFAALGAPLSFLPPVVDRQAVRLDELIDRLERGEFSATWRIEPATRAQAAQRVRAWAEQAYGPLDQLVPTERAIAWRAYRLPV